MQLLYTCTGIGVKRRFYAPGRENIVYQKKKAYNELGVGGRKMQKDEELIQMLKNYMKR